jgi:hypothetical protein
VTTCAWIAEIIGCGIALIFVGVVIYSIICEIIWRLGKNKGVSSKPKNMEEVMVALSKKSHKK